MHSLGFIGLGIMGSRMAMNLQNAGFPLRVYNRTREHAQPVVEAGATFVDSPAELASQVDILFTMLSEPRVVEQLALGEDGFLKHLKKGSLWVDCTTCNPSFSQHMATAATSYGVRFMDAPVAGSKVPAENGQLLFLVGGDAQDVANCEPYFKVMGRGFNHLGGHGAGAGMKMVVNLLLGNAMLVFAEALNLGEALGFSRQKLLDTLLPTPVVPAFVTGKRHKLEQENYDPEFPLQWMQKDLQLASVTAYEHDTPLPATNTAKEIFQLAKQNGFAQQDFSAIFQFLNETRSNQAGVKD